ncbi:MAG: hypothetical protein HeimC2_40440, partial [Candidatus Heimdallarchaeota archaeon LC_2]
ENLGRNVGIGAVVLGVPYLGYRFVKGGIDNVFGIGGDILGGATGLAQTIGGGLVDGISFLGKDVLYEGIIKTGLVDGLYNTVLKEGLYQTVIQDVWQDTIIKDGLIGFGYETVLKDGVYDTIIKDGIVGGGSTAVNYVTGGGIVDDGGKVVDSLGDTLSKYNPFG